ncbi:MAG TPA: DUF3918 family protein [Chondromyces sp.]|nr:DUF3918 family protein [Chondromyces sp.]
MNKTMTSLVSIGAGMAAMAMMNRNNTRLRRPLRKMTRQFKDMF